LVSTWILDGWLLADT